MSLNLIATAGLKVFKGLHVCAGNCGAPKSDFVSSFKCCGLDHAVLWHPFGFWLPLLHLALQKQQVPSTQCCHTEALQ